MIQITISEEIVNHLGQGRHDLPDYITINGFGYIKPEIQGAVILKLQLEAKKSVKDSEIVQKQDRKDEG